MNMKKLTAAVLAAATLLTACTLFALPGKASLYERGDINGDGAVNAVDAYYLKRVCAGSTPSSELYGTDINCDGKVNTTDIYYLKKCLAGSVVLSELFPEGTGWQGFTVAGRSVDGFEIVVTDTENDNMYFAAEELAKYANEGDGSTLSIVDTAGDAEHRFVFTADTTGELGDDGFCINVTNGDVYIRAGAKRGSMYAVYALLEDFWGWRFYTYDNCELLRDKKSDIAEGTEYKQLPSFECRSNCMTPYGNDYTYSSVIKRKLNGCTDQPSMQKSKYGWGICRLFANAHSFDVFIPLDEISSTTVRCLSKTLCYDVCLKNMKALIDDRVAAGGVIGNDITQISCSYAADESYCSCRYCYKVYNEEKSYAGILVRFVNKIDDALHKDYPDITVVTNAYSKVRKPPEVTSLNDDIVLLYCWNGCTNHNIDSGECGSGRVNDGGVIMGSNKTEKEYFLGWASKCKNIYIWYYPTNIYYLLCPQPNFFKLYDDFRWFKEQGVKGFYVVGTSGSSFEDLDAYLISEMMWNADMTREEYELKAKEYLKYCYGYGWIYIWQYMEMLRECGDLKGCVLNDFELPFDIYSIDYFAENFGKMQELFAKAEKSAANDRERANIELLSLHMRFLGYSATYERDWVSGTEESRAAYSAGWKEVYDLINDLGVRTTYSERGISAEFTLDKSPMELVYGVSGIR